MALKPPTQWLPPNRQGTVVNLGNIFLVDNAGNFLVDNSGDFLVTTIFQMNPTPAALWSTSTVPSEIDTELGSAIQTEEGFIIYTEDYTPAQVKPLTQWLPPARNGTVVDLSNTFMVDNAGTFLVDNSGNFLVTTPFVINLTPPTLWNPDGVFDNIEDENGGLVDDELNSPVYSEDSL